MMFFGGCGHVYGVCGAFDRCPDAIHRPAPDHSCGHDARASGGFFRSCRALSITPLSPLRTLWTSMFAPHAIRRRCYTVSLFG